MRPLTALGLAHAAMMTCRLELMGLPDAAAYRRLARGVLRRGTRWFSGLNIPNKKPGEPLLEWAEVLLQELPDLEVCVHYSLKHQRGKGNPAAAFERFCHEAAELGVARVLLVTGPRGPATDSLAVLGRLAARHPAPGRLKIGVAFNACLPTEPEREMERQRLAQKLRTGLVEDVWLNCGSEPALFAAGVAFVRSAAKDLATPQVDVFGSVLLPNEAQLQQMRERPWNGVHFSEEYLSSLEGMGRVTGEVLAALRAGEAEPIVESKVRSDEDLRKLGELLAGVPRDTDEAPAPAAGRPASPPKLRRPPRQPEPAGAGPAPRRRRWLGGGRGLRR